MKQEIDHIDESIVTLDSYNSDLNLVIDASKYSAHPLTKEGFAFMWAGARATHGADKGKMCFEVKVIEHLDVSHLPTDEPNPHVVRIGFSVDSTSMQLGEDPLSYGYGGTGKISTNCQFRDFGPSFSAGDAILAVVNLESDPIQIGFAKNGNFLGWAYKVRKSELKGKALFPHVLTKNCSFEVNFGQRDEPYFKLSEAVKDFVFIGCLPMDQRVGGTRPPEKREECEMIMMCGLPGAGKSVWAADYSTKNLQKKYNVLGTNNIIDKMKVMGLPRKRNYHGRWDVLIQMATKCLNTMFSIGSKLRRNYILDQTNVYPTAQRRKMRNFDGFKRTAVVVVPTDAEYKKRCDKRDREEGKEIPDHAVLEMKANFKIPEDKDIFDNIIFTELQRDESEKLVKQYNEEGKAATGPARKHFRSNEPMKDRSFDSGKGNFGFNKNEPDFQGGYGGSQGNYGYGRGGFDGFEGSDYRRDNYGNNQGGYGRSDFDSGYGDRVGYGTFQGRGFDNGRGGRGGFDSGRGGRGGFDRGRGGRGGFDGGRGGRGGFDNGRGGRGSFDNGRGGRGGTRGGFDGSPGGRGGYDSDYGARGNYDNSPSGYDNMRSGRGGYDNGRGGRGGYDNGRGGRGGYDSGRGGRGGYDVDRGGRGFEQGGRSFDHGGRGFDQGGRGFDQGGRGFDQGGRGFDSDRGGRGYDGDRGGRGYDSDRGGRGVYDSGRGGRGSFGGDINRGGRGGFDNVRGGRGNYDTNRGGRGSYDNRGGRDGYDSSRRGGYSAGSDSYGGFDKSSNYSQMDQAMYGSSGNYSSGAREGNYGASGYSYGSESFSDRNYGTGSSDYNRGSSNTGFQRGNQDSTRGGNTYGKDSQSGYYNKDYGYNSSSYSDYTKGGNTSDSYGSGIASSYYSGSQGVKTEPTERYTALNTDASNKYSQGTGYSGRTSTRWDTAQPAATPAASYSTGSSSSYAYPASDVSATSVPAKQTYDYQQGMSANASQPWTGGQTTTGVSPASYVSSSQQPWSQYGQPAASYQYYPTQ